MKTLYRISLIVNMLGICSLLIWGGYKVTEYYLRKDKPQERTEEKVLLQKAPPQIKSVSKEEDVLTCDTEYFVSSYDMTTGEEHYEQEKLPPAYYGKTRKQMLDLLSDYAKSPTLEDQEKGFVSIELNSFSSEKVSVQKIYESECYYGCIVVEDGYLSVYDEAREHVVLYTDISFDALPDELKQQILDGKYIKTEDELYNFLESYSS